MIYYVEAKHRQPVIAWVLQAGGEILPVVPGGDGIFDAMELSERSDREKVAFWHPDSSDKVSLLLRRQRRSSEKFCRQTVGSRAMRSWSN
jgi:hypothetical protein